MKTMMIHSIRAAIFAGTLAVAGLAQAQTTTTQSTTTTTSAGTVAQFSPDSMTIRTETSPAPVSYSFTKTTTYVDENGNPVSVDVVRSGAPVTVYYTQDGDRMVASKVVVRRVTTDAGGPIIDKKSSSTTTTTTSGAQ